MQNSYIESFIIKKKYPNKWKLKFSKRYYCYPSNKKKIYLSEKIDLTNLQNLKNLKIFHMF